MTDQEALKAAIERSSGLEYLSALDAYSSGWHAALAYLRSQQEPVAWMSPGKERLEFSRKDTVYGSHTLPLYLAPQPAIPDGWREAIESISEFGDDTLCDEAFHAIRADKDAAEMALRIAVRLTKEEAIEKLEKLAAPEVKR